MTVNEIREKINAAYPKLSETNKMLTKALVEAYQRGLFDGIELCTGMKVPDEIKDKLQ